MSSGWWPVERPYRAALPAEQVEVPVVVRQVTEDTRGLDDALIENMARADLTPVEDERRLSRRGD